MNKFGVLSAAAGLALVLPLAVPSASFAQARIGGGGGGGGGGAHVSMGGGGARMGGGGGGASFHGGGSFHRGSGSFAAAARPVGAPAATIGSGGRSFATAAPSGSYSGTWSGRHWRGHRHGGFWPGVAAGATIGALGSYAYYGGGYYDPYYYDDGYYGDGAVVAVGPGGGDDSVAYCQQRFKSYDPASGTYLGYDGQRHPCP
jgi:hypothetical protein